MPFGTLAKDMQLTPEEFRRRLPIALEGYEWRDIAAGYEARSGDRAVRITVTPSAPRRIALLELPRCLVSFAFEGFTEAAQGEFLARFDRVYQKGGG